MCLLPGIVIWCFTATGFCVWILKLCFACASPRGEQARSAALQEAILPKTCSSPLLCLHMELFQLILCEGKVILVIFRMLLPSMAFNNLCSASSECERTSPSSSTGRGRPFWWQPSSPFSFGSGVLLSSKSSSLSQSLFSEKSPFRSSFRVFRNSLFLSVVRRVNLVRREELISMGGVVLEGLCTNRLQTATTGILRVTSTWIDLQNLVA